MTQTEKVISNQTQAIQYFIEKMDIEMVDAFLDNDKTYQDFEKHNLSNTMKKLLEHFTLVDEL